jgi:Bac_Flav_CT_G: Bacteroides conjugation system ATPase, TraG family
MIKFSILRSVRVSRH